MKDKLSVYTTTADILQYERILKLQFGFKENKKGGGNVISTHVI